MHRHYKNEYKMYYLRDCNWLCMFFNHRGRKWEGKEMNSMAVCVLPWSTPWATASTWQRGLSSDGTSSDTAETDSGYYGNKNIRRQMNPLHKFPLKLRPQHYFDVIQTKCTQTSNMAHKYKRIRRNFSGVKNVGNVVLYEHKYKNPHLCLWIVSQVIHRARRGLQ